MKLILRLALLIVSFLPFGFAQQASIPAGSGAATAIPALVRFSDTLTDQHGEALTDVAGVTFLLYRDSQGGAPLWMETQNVHPDKGGHYSVVLGSTASQGLPQDVFASGQARWLAVQVAGQPERPRLLLVAVPYALKARDAETIGGLPPSAFVLAAPPVGGTAKSDATISSGVDVPPAAAITGSGTTGFLPDFTGAATVGNSAVFQTGTSPTAKIGINTSAPTTALDIHGGAAVRGTLVLPSAGAATSATGKVSEPINVTASAFNSGTSAAVGQTFQMKAEPVNNNTATPGASLNLLFGQGTTTPAETGFKIANSGILTFASGQTFPGTGKGTVTSIATGLGLKGGPITGAGTLSIDATIVPQLNVANIFTTSQSVTGNFSASSDIIAGNALAAASMSVNGSTIGVSARGSEYGGIFSTTTGGTGLYSYNSNDCNFCVGVEGYAFGSSNNTVGVFGSTASPFGVGVYGQLVGTSATGADYFSSGVWGDAGTATDGFGDIGVLGTADDNVAMLAASNSSSQYPTLLAHQHNIDSYSFQAYGDGGYCHIDASGNLGCTGVVAGVVPVDAGARKVQVYAVEAPQHWFEDAGSGQLSEGKATVTLEPIFGQTVNTSIEYHVFLTPGGDCEGLYVSNKTPQGFEVHELRGGHSSVAFDYRIMATRKGYENVRLAEERPIAAPGIRRRSVPLKARAPLEPFVPGHATLMGPVAQPGAPEAKNQ